MNKDLDVITAVKESLSKKSWSYKKVFISLLLALVVISVFSFGHFEYELSTYKVFAGRVEYYFTLPV